MKILLAILLVPALASLAPALPLLDRRADRAEWQRLAAHPPASPPRPKLIGIGMTARVGLGPAACAGSAPAHARPPVGRCASAAGDMCRTDARFPVSIADVTQITFTKGQT